MRSRFGKCENGVINVGLERSINSDLRTSSLILVFSTWKQNISSQFFYLDIENTLPERGVRYLRARVGSPGAVAL
jgi:hypothetical protein